MAVANVYSNGVLVNGRATVSIGSGFTVVVPSSQIYHDDSSREQVFGSVSGTETIENIDSRYYFHGGPGGSSNWEH